MMAALSRPLVVAPVPVCKMVSVCPKIRVSVTAFLCFVEEAGRVPAKRMMLVQGAFHVDIGRMVERIERRVAILDERAAKIPVHETRVTRRSIVREYLGAVFAQPRLRYNRALGKL